MNTWLWWPEGIELLGPTEHLLCKATFARLGDIADLPNIDQQIERSVGNEQIREYVPNNSNNNKKTNISEKEINESKLNTLPHREFKVMWS